MFHVPFGLMYQLYRQIASIAYPKNSLCAIKRTKKRLQINNLTLPNICTKYCQLLLIDFRLLTDDLSTLDAEFAHFTNASKRMNNCLVLAEKL